jgi:hypothetical protein
MGSFSSRGPGPVADILKPDVTAPGINILAGSTPDAANSVSGEFFAFLTGTSMSTPHVAGVAALIMQAHPDWSPAAIKSALMTTAYQNITVTLRDGTTVPTIPWDFGSGHIDPNKANDPGLVYDISADEYDAFSCGVGSPDVTQARCDELERDGFSLEPADLNQPSISVSRLISTRTITRRVTNVSDVSETYIAEIELPPGVDVQVTPGSISVVPGESVTYEVTLIHQSGQLDQDQPLFGSLTWVSSNHSVRSVISVRPISLDAPYEKLWSGVDGNDSFSVNFGYSGLYFAGVDDLDPPDIALGSVDNDPNKTFTLRSGDGVTLFTYDVPADQAFLRFATFDEHTDGNDDLDMFVYYCDSTIDLCQEGTNVFIDNFSKIGQSGEETSCEQVDVLFPHEGIYAVFIHGFATEDLNGTNYELHAWQLGIVNNPNIMTATGPPFVNVGDKEDVTVNWSGLDPDRLYLGGILHNIPEVLTDAKNGLVSLTVISVKTTTDLRCR